ncbi:MAG TPA: ABC transporter permease [Candidatus Acidoferrales bacterium]|nr:ABC transporter permease [Candidatus Acidoferrales bacterium]
MGTLLQDLRYAIRILLKSPGFTAIAVMTLALGIGANTALFSVVNGVLLNPLPYPHPEQLVTLHGSKPNFPTGSISYPNFLDWQKDNRTFSAMAISRGYSFSLTGSGDAEQENGEFVSSDFFALLDVKPEIGRLFAPGEDRIGAAPIVIISAGLWKRKFGSGRDALGKSLTLDGRNYTIVGVIPATFNFRVGSFRPSEVYVPIGQWNNNSLLNRGAGLGLHGIGRLKPGITLAQARADMDEVTRSLAAAYPDNDKGLGAAIIPLKESMVGRIEPILLVLFGAVGFVLLIACVNVANLLLARSTGRAREFAIRAALGAGQDRLLRQLLTESVLLAVAGGTCGLLLANWGTQAALEALPITLPRAGEVGMDARVLIFSAAISLFAGILFGLAPALKTSQPNLHEALKEGGRGASGARRGVHGVFVVAEMAMAVVLLVGAGLMIRSLASLWSVNPGFNPKNVLVFGLSLPPSLMKASPDAIRSAFREVDNKLKSTVGVQAVSATWAAIPMAGEDDTVFWIAGQPKPASQNEMNWALNYVVEPDYLEAMGIPLERGRFFTPQDNEHAQLVTVVDDVFARKYFGDEDPIGKRIILDNGERQPQIVGIVGHVKQWGLDSDDSNSLRAQFYFPFMQLSDSGMALSPSGTAMIVRSAIASPGLFDSIRRKLQQLNSEYVVFGAQTMDEIISSSLSTRSFSMILLGCFAALALVLSSIGIYGVISYLAGQRTHEIGVRLALGAQRRDVLRLVLGEGVKMALIGVAIGLAAAIGLTRLMSTLLYGVSATDPLTFAGVAILLIIVALAACYIPARRAMRVDPMVALRYE